MTRTSLCACFLSVLCLPAALLAQEEEFTPPNEQVDRELDESLRREYGPDGRPIERALPPDVEPLPPPAHPIDDPDEDDEWELKLGALAAHYYTWIDGVRVSSRNGSSGGGTIDLTRHHAVADYDPHNSQTYRAWFDIGRWISLEAGFRRTNYRSDAQPTAIGFTYGRTTFAAGTPVETELDQATIDADFVFKPINNRWFELRFSFGSRYLYSETTIRNVASPVSQTERDRIEMAVPMIGAGIAFRPIPGVELFARGRVGHFGYERDEAFIFDDDDVRHIEPKEKSATSGEVDAGLQILIADTIGVVGGYRLDYLKMEREVTNREERVRSFSHGVYGGVILQF